jgi:hypothetical protein
MWNFAINIESSYLGWEPGSVPDDVQDIGVKGTRRNKASLRCNGRMTLVAWKDLAKNIQRFGGRCNRPSGMLDSLSSGSLLEKLYT